MTTDGRKSRPHVVTAPKDVVYELRMNSEIKAELERIFAGCGITLPDAIDVFFQQSLNQRGFPFPVVSDQETARRDRTADSLLEIHRKGMESGVGCGWTSEADMEKELDGI